MAVPAQQKKKSSAAKQATATKTVSKNTKRKTAKPAQTKKKSSAQKQAPVTVQGLKSQRQQIQKQIKEQESRLRANERNVKQRLQTLMVINTEIDDKRRSIDTIRRDIGQLSGSILEIDK
jgi:chromosome segregation ATPase